MVDKILNVNTLLILLAVGTIVWAVRQVTPDRIESNRIWKAGLRVVPIFIGIGISCIPQLRPLPDIVQSIVVGGFAGSLSANVYGFLREALGRRIKYLLGSRSARRVDAK